MIKNWTLISQVVKNGSIGVMKREAYIMSRTLRIPVMVNTDSGFIVNT